MLNPSSVTMERAALPRVPTLRSDSFFEGCTFCRGNKALKKMGDIYIHDGKEEDYDYMLHTCFGVKGNGERGERLICEECVRRLRAALSFRRLVVAGAPTSSLSSCGDDASDPPPPGIQKRTSNNSPRYKPSYTSSLTMRNLANANIPSKFRRNNQIVRSVSRDPSYLRRASARPANPRYAPAVQCRICRNTFTLPNVRKRLSKSDMRSFICGSCFKVLKPSQLKRSVSAGAKKSARVKGEQIVGKSVSLTPKRGVYSRAVSRGKTSSSLIHQKPSSSVRRRSASRMSQFGCQVCGKVFTSTKSLDLHMRKHVGQPMFQCRLCPKVYKDKRILTRHVKAVHA